MKKVSFYAGNGRTLTVQVYDNHPQTKEQVDGGFIYNDALKALFEEKVIDQNLKDYIEKNCEIPTL